MVPGNAPFLLSRKVLQGMEATLDLGQCTLSSSKHGFEQFPLQQAANGHLLLPLTPSIDQRFQVAEESGSEEAACLAQPEPEASACNAAGPCGPMMAGEARPEQACLTPADLKRHFQTILKNTRYTQVDIGTYRSRDQPKPRGIVHVSPWCVRTASGKRAEHNSAQPCIFAFKWQAPPVEGAQEARASEQVEGATVAAREKSEPQESCSIVAQPPSECRVSADVEGMSQQSHLPDVPASLEHPEVVSPVGNLSPTYNTLLVRTDRSSRKFQTPSTMCLAGDYKPECDCCLVTAAPGALQPESQCARV